GCAVDGDAVVAGVTYDGAGQVAVGARREARLAVDKVLQAHDGRGVVVARLAEADRHELAEGLLLLRTHLLKRQAGPWRRGVIPVVTGAVAEGHVYLHALLSGQACQEGGGGRGHFSREVGDFAHMLPFRSLIGWILDDLRRS